MDWKQGSTMNIKTTVSECQHFIVKQRQDRK